LFFQDLNPRRERHAGQIVQEPPYNIPHEARLRLPRLVLLLHLDPIQPRIKRSAQVSMADSLDPTRGHALARSLDFAQPPHLVPPAPPAAREDTVLRTGKHQSNGVVSVFVLLLLPDPIQPRIERGAQVPVADSLDPTRGHALARGIDFAQPPHLVPPAPPATREDTVLRTGKHQ
jgi:hypothetical protein